jgi:hypothetical protein
MNEFCDSFGIYALAVIGTPATFGPSQQSLLTRWNAIGTGNSQIGVLANKGNRGNPALYLPFGASIAKTFSRQATYTVGFRLNMGCAAGVGNSTVPLIELGAVTTQPSILASLLVKADGSILVFGNDDLSTVICTAPVAIVANTDCYLEFSATISATTNMNVAAEVRVNGVTVGAGNANIGRNANTLASRVANFKFLVLNSGVATTGQAYISDFYINNGAGATNNGFAAGMLTPYAQLGYLLPSADGSQLDWTPLSGSVHYTEIDEIPQDGDVSYVSTATPGAIDSYHWQPIASFAGTVPTVQMSFCARSDQEGLRTFKGNIGPGGGQQQTPEFGLCSGNFYRSASFDLDPTTGLPWTQAAFNSRQFGIGLVR